MKRAILELFVFLVLIVDAFLYFIDVGFLPEGIFHALIEIHRGFLALHICFVLAALCFVVTNLHKND